MIGARCNGDWQEGLGAEVGGGPGATVSRSAQQGGLGQRQEVLYDLLEGHPDQEKEEGEI